MGKKNGGKQKSSSSSSDGVAISLDPNVIYFTFSRIRPVFSCGRTIESTKQQFVNGELCVTDLPLLCVFTDGEGRYYSQNNRRLYLYKSLKEAGVLEQIAVRLRPLPDTKRMGHKYSPSKCSLAAKLMGRAAPLTSELPDGDDHLAERNDREVESSEKQPVLTPRSLGGVRVARDESTGRYSYQNAAENSQQTPDHRRGRRSSQQFLDPSAPELETHLPPAESRHHRQCHGSDSLGPPSEVHTEWELGKKKGKERRRGEGEVPRLNKSRSSIVQIVSETPEAAVAAIQHHQTAKESDAMETSVLLSNMLKRKERRKKKRALQCQACPEEDFGGFEGGTQ